LFSAREHDVMQEFVNTIVVIAVVSWVFWFVVLRK
jgi:hypothetical protein